METKALNFVGRGITYLVILLAVAIFSVSCEEDPSDFTVEPKVAEVSDVNAINSNKGMPLENGKRGLKPGEKSIATIAIEAGFSELVAALQYVDEEMNTEYRGIMVPVISYKIQFQT